MTDLASLDDRNNILYVTERSRLDVDGSSNVSEENFAALWEYVKQRDNGNRLSIGNDIPPFTPHDVYKDWLDIIFRFNAPVHKQIGLIGRKGDQTRYDWEYQEQEMSRRRKEMASQF